MLAFNYILVALLVVLLAIDYYIFSRRNLFTPSIIVISTFLLSSVVFTFNYEYFMTKLEFNTVAVIIGSCIAWIIGECFSRKVRLTVNLNRINNFHEEQNRTRRLDPCLMIVDPPLMVVMCTMMVIVLYFRFMAMFKVAILGGGGGNILRSFGYARDYLLMNENVSISAGPIVNQLFVFGLCFTYYCMYAFINNIVKFKRVTKSYLLVLLIVSFQLLCDTSRSTIMNFYISITFILLFIICSDNHWNKVVNKRIIRVMILALFFVLFLFSILAYLTSREGISKTTSIIKYIGSPLVGLNLYLNNAKTENFIWGQETLYYLYQLFREWGANIPWYKWHQEFYAYGNGATSNIYTALRRPIQDYGIAGMLFTRMIIGSLYMVLFNKIKNENLNNYNVVPRVVFFCLLSVPLTMMSITDAFPSFISTSTLYYLFYLWLIKTFGFFKLIPIGVQNENNSGHCNI